MDKGLIVKAYDIDYSFIIKNYLDPKLWEKEWTLFIYKEFVVTLKLSSIDCSTNKIHFYLKLKDTGDTREYRYDWGIDYDKNVIAYINYSLKIEDINFLKRKIQSGIYSLISDLEKKYTRSLDIYRQTEENAEYEEAKLRKIAEDFLDDNNVSNIDIREVYIENYIENNKKIDEQLDNILDSYRFKLFTDLYLVFANSTKDEELIEKAKKDTSEVLNIEIIKKEVDEYLEYLETEEFEEEMASELENI